MAKGARKQRTPIPPVVVADVLFAADHTCCVCNESGMPVQIHHIDDDPANNALDNLAVLCLVDHDRTMTRGGFGRHLLSAEVILYRNNWNRRVVERRNAVDEALARAQSSVFSIPRAEAREDFMGPPLAFVDVLPAVRKKARARSERLWAGSTQEMREGARLYIDTMEGILVALAAYCPSRISGEAPREYFSRTVAARFEWHRLQLEPEGPGTGGTIVSVEAAAAVMMDLEGMVLDVVEELCSHSEDFDFPAWKQRWTSAEPTDTV
jgi:hypothetical protein